MVLSHSIRNSTTNLTVQAQPARPKTSSLEPRRSANFKSPFQISDDYASTRASTPANLATRRRHPRPPHPPPLSTTPRTSNICSTNPSSTNSETTRPLRKRSPDRLEEAKSAMQPAWKRLVDLASHWTMLSRSDTLPSSMPCAISTMLFRYSSSSPIFPPPKQCRPR